jgi:hypothetical protein
MNDPLITPPILVFVALAFQSLGFLARDELWLRVMILVGTGFYLAYYWSVDDHPLKEAIIASGVLGVINLGMIIVLIFERTTFAMSDEMTAIYRCFPTLNPGQFRKVMKAGIQREAKPDTVLVRDGVPLQKLILVTNGQVRISKGEKQYRSDASVFIGEVSFLRKGNASATVTVSKPASYVEWKHSDLRRMMRKSHAMNNALIALFGAELAGKVENAMPVNLEEQNA